MNYIADIGITILIVATLAATLNLLIGFTGQFSQAHAIFYGIGAYTTGLFLLRAGAPIIVAIIASIIVSFLFAWFIAIPAMRRVTGEFVLLLTISFQMVVNQLMTSLVSFTGGAYGLAPIPPLEIFGKPSFPPYVFLLFLVVASIIILFCMWLGRSPFGRLLRGIREDEFAVRAVGKATISKKLTIFGVSAALAGLIGGLGAMYYQYIAPQSFNLDYSIFLVAVVVLGGTGNILGSVVGAVILGSVHPILQTIPNIGENAFSWQGVIYGFLLIILMFFRPEGLIPEKFKSKKISTSGEEVDIPLEKLFSMYKKAKGGSGSTVLTIDGMSKRFGGIQAVKDVNMGLQKNKITALIGPNGAGKTTIFKLITGALKPDEGKIKLFGNDIYGLEPHQVAQLGMVRSFQDVRLFQKISVLENIAIAIPKQGGEKILSLMLRPFKSIHNEKKTLMKAMKYLQIVGMKDKAYDLVTNLSYGEQKLVAIARLLATECEVLLLDEPTSGIDPSAVDEMIDVIIRLRNAGKTICIVEHSLHVVEKLADHIVFLESGTVLAEGTLVDLTAQNELVEAYFGV